MRLTKSAFFTFSLLTSGIVSCSDAPAPYVAHGTAGSDGVEYGSNNDAEPAKGSDAVIPPVAGNTSPTPVPTPATPTPSSSPSPTPSTSPMPGTDPATDAAAIKAAAVKEGIAKVTAAFDGFRWEFPCDKDVGTSETCDSKASVSQTKVLPEAAGTKFSVELRFRGVVEPMMYKDGKLAVAGGRFYVGGVGNNPTYNIYSIEVSNPKQIYYLNAADAVGHLTDIVDYKAKIEVAAGATIKLIGNGQNGVEIANFKKLVVPDVLPTTAYNGQFLQMNVVSVIPVVP